MSRKRTELTPAIEQAILAYVRAGGFPEVAAEAAGVSRDDFAWWLKQGNSPRGGKRYRAFAEAVRQAVAQARLGAEVAAKTDRPLDWLRNGPGRETPETTGWTGTVKPRGGRADASLLTDPQVRALLSALMDALAAFPEARAAVADRLTALAAPAPPTPR
ncbi:MAG: hypothetical protein U0736_19440 [Gemmataceae bacterium]